jgi:hypothetical protein
MKKSFKIITQGWISLFVLLIWIFSLMFNFIAPLGSVSICHDIYFNFIEYRKEFIKIDTIYSTGVSEDGKYAFLHAQSKNKVIEKFGSGRYYINERDEIRKKYEKNDKYLNIWVSPNSKDAYFDTPALNNTTQLQLWYQPLTEICFFILMTFILVRWSKYFKKELSKYGLTTSEFHKLRKDGKLNEYVKNYENYQNNLT